MSYTSELVVNAVSTSSKIEPQWFIVRGWLDQEEWGDEPPDPDDVWAVGDRVKMKGFDYVGTVVRGDSAPFLHGYLPYIFVQWEHKTHPTPIVPEQLIRLTRFIPPGLTWKAEDSFSDDCKEMLSVQLQQTSFKVGDRVSSPSGEGVICHIHGKKATVDLRNLGRKEQIKLCHLTLINKADSAVQLAQARGTLKIKEEEAMVAAFNLESTGFKPGQEVFVKKGNKRIKRVVGDRTGSGKDYGRVLTLGGRSGREEYWEDPSKLELPQKVETVQPEEDLLSLVYSHHHPVVVSKLS